MKLFVPNMKLLIYSEKCEVCVCKKVLVPADVKHEALVQTGGQQRRERQVKGLDKERNRRDARPSFQ